MTTHVRSTLMPLLLSAGLVAISGCGTSEDPVGGSGLIETTETLVSAETAGRMTKRFFDEGRTVSIGDTLAVIDPSHLELQLASAKAGKTVLATNLETARLKVNQAASAQRFAETELERVKRLLNSGTATKRQFDQTEFEHTQAGIAHQTARAGVATLEAELTRVDVEIKRLERLISDCYPVAPTNGVIVEKYVNPGELLSPGKPIAKIAQLDTVEVKVYLTAGVFANLTLGTIATVSTESGGTDHSGTVVWTSEEAEFTPKNVQTAQSRADLVYAVKISIPNPDRTLKVGMPVFVTLEQ